MPPVTPAFRLKPAIAQLIFCVVSRTQLVLQVTGGVEALCSCLHRRGGYGVRCSLQRAAGTSERFNVYLRESRVATSGGHSARRVILNTSICVARMNEYLLYCLLLRILPVFRS